MSEGRTTGKKTINSYLEVCVVNMFEDQSRRPGLKNKKKAEGISIQTNNMDQQVPIYTSIESNIEHMAGMMSSALGEQLKLF